MSPTSPHILLIPVGSSGDVHPFVGIGRALAQRGHDVTLATAEPFREMIEKAGLRCVVHQSEEEFHGVIAHPDLWHPRKGVRLVLREVARRLQDAYDGLCEDWDPSNTLLVEHSLAFAARVYEEAHHVRAVTVHLAPSVFRSVYQMPAYAPGRDAALLPTALKRAMWSLIDRLMIDPHIVPPLNQLRAGAGLPPIARPFQSWMHSPQRTIGLFPPWFGPPQPDWPKAARLTGFPLFDEADQHEMTPDLEAFLRDGDPPVVFTPGSAHRQAEDFFTTAIDATALLKRRALLLTRYPEQLPDRLPDDVRHELYVPLSQLLPRCAALVHHGGVGTSAQGLAAGIPQLTTPMGFDQPDNATRLHRLGVSTWISRPSKFTPKRVARALDELLASDGVVQACRRWKGEIAASDPVRETCELIERRIDSRTV